MNILHIVPGLEDPTCGIAVAAKMIAARQRADGNCVKCLDSKAWSYASVSEADEVWVHSMWTPGVMMAACAALRLGRRLVRMPHGCMDPVKLRHHGWKKWIVAPIERRLFRCASVVVATEKSEEEWIKAFVVSPRKIEMVPLGSPSALEGYFDATLPRGDGRLSLLYIGRLTPLKGVRYLLEAMPPSSKLVVIGKDEGELKICRRIAAERSLDVDFRGVVSEEEKEKAYAECDVLVLPTLSENFGLVVAEALSHGKRVITTDGAPAWEGHDGVVYITGYRAGSDEDRVRYLREAILALRK